MSPVPKLNPSTCIKREALSEAIARGVPGAAVGVVQAAGNPLPHRDLLIRRQLPGNLLKLHPWKLLPRVWSTKTKTWSLKVEVLKLAKTCPTKPFHRLKQASSKGNLLNWKAGMSERRAFRKSHVLQSVMKPGERSQFANRKGHARHGGIFGQQNQPQFRKRSKR